MNDQLTRGLDHSKTFEVIPSRRWRRDDGLTASPYGAAPWTSDAERDRWTLEPVGWTVRHLKTGTVGIGRQTWPTEQAALDWLHGRAPF